MGRTMHYRIASPFGGVEVRIEAGRLKEVRLLSANHERANGRGPLIAQMRRYFAGDAVSFLDVDVDLSGFTPFERSVFDATRALSWGQVATYGDIAKAIGKPRAQRAVGQALHRNPICIVIPCHRVVASDGLGGFGGGLRWKKNLLRLEGTLGKATSGLGRTTREGVDRLDRVAIPSLSRT